MTVPNPAHDRTYPLAAPAEDRRFTLGLVFALAQLLVDHGYPRITAGGDLVALQQALYAFIYRAPDDGGFAERFLEERRASRTPEQRRDGLAELALSKLVSVGMLDTEVVAALLSLWDRRDRLTAVELGAIRAALAEEPQSPADPEAEQASTTDLPTTDEPMTLRCRFDKRAFCVVHNGVHIEMLPESAEVGPR